MSFFPMSVEASASVIAAQKLEVDEVKSAAASMLAHARNGNGNGNGAELDLVFGMTPAEERILIEGFVCMVRLKKRLEGYPERQRGIYQFQNLALSVGAMEMFMQAVPGFLARAASQQTDGKPNKRRLTYEQSSNGSAAESA